MRFKILNNEQKALNQVVAELAARGLCSSEIELYNFDDYCNWLADLTNNHEKEDRVDYAFALYSLNVWSHEITDIDFKLESQQVIYKLIKYTINIFTRK
ncbi:hypothetical protein [Shewanella colwelliana]|uniref:hypothetical protein n=1 Tax=Shewanella colwelliana TaxID=23 RepID=UPI00049069EA|nr:hypothetical protein [Shewanella colwelliana]